MITVLFHKDVLSEDAPASVTLDGDTIAFNSAGCILVLKGKEDVVGMFPGHHVVGAYNLDGPNLIQGVKGILVK